MEISHVSAGNCLKEISFLSESDFPVIKNIFGYSLMLKFTISVEFSRNFPKQSDKIWKRFIHRLSFTGSGASLMGL